MFGRTIWSVATLALTISAFYFPWHDATNSSWAVLGEWRAALYCLLALGLLLAAMFSMNMAVPIPDSHFLLVIPWCIYLYLLLRALL